MSPGASGKLSVWAGRILVFMGFVHLILVATRIHQHWSGWFTGTLRGVANLDANPASALAFWAMPGSFAIPLILLGLLISRLAKQGQEIPVYLMWTLGAWMVLSSIIMQPSGFPIGIIPVALLLADHRRHRPAIA